MGMLLGIGIRTVAGRVAIIAAATARLASY
jgi:hypothetical protein